MAEDSTLEWIGRQSRRTPLLTPGQEIELSRRIQEYLPLLEVKKPSAKQRRIIKSGRRAYDQFFCANIRLVMLIAKHYAAISQSMTLDDLVQEGMIGLQRAIVKFDATRGYKFSTYAFRWIRQSILRGLHYQGRTIRLPIHIVDLIKQLKRCCDEYSAKHGRWPSVTILAEKLGSSPETIKVCLMHLHEISSLNAAPKSRSHHESYMELLDCVPGETLAEPVDTFAHDRVMAAIDALPAFEREIIEGRYLSNQPLTLRELGEAANLSRERIRQLETRALQKLRMILADRPQWDNFPRYSPPLKEADLEAA